MRTRALIVLWLAACGDNAVVPPDAAIPMHLRGISPAHGPQFGGTTIVLDGDGFDPDGPPPTVIVGRTLATEVGVVDPYTVTATTPFGVQPGPADVVIAGGDTHARLDLAFTYDPLPQIITIDPAQGPAAGGTRVTITGTGFVANDAGPPTVRFGDLDATDVVVVSDEEIQATTPPGPPFAGVNVLVTNHDGPTLSNPGFRYTARGLIVGANYYGPPIGVFYVDPSTGITTEIQELDFEPWQSNTIHSLASDGHVLWGTTHWYSTPPVLFSFDTTAAFATHTVGPVAADVTNNLDCIDLELVADQLYCVTYGALYTIDRSSAAATLVATVPEPPYDMALATVGDTTYLVSGECCTQASFAPIDLATGAIGAPTPITLDGQPLEVYVSGATGYDGAIILLVDGGFDTGGVDIPVVQTGTIFRIDPATGAATLIGRVPFEPQSITTIDP